MLNYNTKYPPGAKHGFTAEQWEQFINVIKEDIATERAKSYEKGYQSGQKIANERIEFERKQAVEEHKAVVRSEVTQKRKECADNEDFNYKCCNPVCHDLTFEAVLKLSSLTETK